MDESATDRDPLEVVAEEFMERQRQGESPSVEEYASSHPDLAEQIRELFPTIAAMERLKARSERSSDGLASLGPIKLKQLGDFRIIQEIGRGGMGIVFEAEQESLGRRVALKVLPRQALMEQRHLARFRREAKIASRLHHTNIVQVYGVGEEEGFHYYVMQYVHGVGLDKIVQRVQSIQAGDRNTSGEGEEASPRDELLEAVASGMVGTEATRRPPLLNPEYYRSVAGIGKQAAEALAYAHEQDTLHRDIKPANLLLDDQGVLWVIDFGLARAAHAPDVTQPGDLTGTLRYLAPERFSGQTDERGDIYSLGLTLYELLTLRPAYDETDRSTLIHRISQQSPMRPRALNPVIPRDLETIVLKAISREPEHRYATATEMGNDLRRFLEDRPVMARRIGPVARMWRWCRRNRAVASLAASTLLMVLAVAVVATVGYARTRRALTREAWQRQRAEAVVAVASEALDRVFSRLGPSRAVQSSLTVGGAEGTSIQMVTQPVISKETAALLEEMLPFYDRLAEQTGDGAALQRRAAGARRRIGDIRQRLGQYNQAAAAYRRAIDMYRVLATEEASDQTLPVSMSEAYNELGKTYLLVRRVADAQEAHRHALDLLKGIGTEASPTARFELARTYFFLGQRVHPEPGIKGPGRRPPPPLQEGSPARPPPDGWPPHDKRPGSVGMGPGSDPHREARNRHLDGAIALLKGLNQEQPEDPEYRHLLALCYREFVAPPGQAQLNATDAAIEILEGLVRDFPQIADYRFDLCETYATVEAMDPALSRGLFPAMEERLRKALTISERLVVQHPNVPEYLASQARVHHKLGEVLCKMHRLDDAEQSNRKALEVQTRLAKDFPEIVTYQVWEAAFRNSLADLLLLRGDLAEGKSVAETNVARTSRLLDDHPELWYLHAILMDVNRTLAAVLRQSGQRDAALQIEQAAEEHRRHLRAARDGAGSAR